MKLSREQIEEWRQCLLIPYKHLTDATSLRGASQVNALCDMALAVEGLEKDAEFYRYLRDRTTWKPGEFAICLIAFDGHHTVLQAPEEIEARLTTAMKKDWPCESAHALLFGCRSP